MLRATLRQQDHHEMGTTTAPRTDAAAADRMETTLMRRKITANGVPIPEMIGGAIIGATASMVLTYIQEWRSFLDPGSPGLYLVLGVAALIGAAISFVLARKHVVEVKQRVVEEREVEARRAA